MDEVRRWNDRITAEGYNSVFGEMCKAARRIERLDDGTMFLFDDGFALAVDDDDVRGGELKFAKIVTEREFLAVFRNQARRNERRKERSQGPPASRPAQPQTLGEYRVDTQFNPAESVAINRLKRLGADLLDLVSGIAPDVRGPDGKMRAEPERERLKRIAEEHVETAVMYAVRAATKPPRASESEVDVEGIAEDHVRTVVLGDSGSSYVLDDGPGETSSHAYGDKVWTPRDLDDGEEAE